MQIDEYLNAHYPEEITVSELCDRFQIGKTRLYEIIKQNYGMGLAEYIRKLRIEKAKELLIEKPGLTLSEIVSQCGFKDYNYFITVFRKMEGVPPKRFQRGSNAFSGLPKAHAEGKVGGEAL